MSAAEVNKLAGQAALKALTRYGSWSSRLRDGCKQRHKQQSAAWAWHHEKHNFDGAALFFSPSLEQSFASLIINVQKQTQHTSYTGMPAQEDTCTHPWYFRMLSHAGAAVLVHKHLAQTSCGTCIHASYECG